MNQQRMLREWRRHHADELQLALDGDSGAIVRRIMEIVRNLTPQKMPTLLRLMDEVDWQLVDFTTKLVILHELNGAIVALRESEGKPAFDDSLPGEPDTLFQVIREMLR